ncbi:MAG: efflux RND transporter permease subunit [Candidatus Kapabacteria bacterium]|nr:efflux RND transporter permease subunit [Candidatus Kapabacteria bacterium]
MKYFKPTNWAIDNKVTVYIVTVVITILGLMSYLSLPKEQIPEIVIPTIIVQTIYPGTSPTDIENQITRPIEKQLKSTAGIKKVTSQSLPDVSVVVVEFQTNVQVPIAKQRVKDAVDKSRTDLPTDLDKDPMVAEIDFSEFPIMFINISGDLEPTRLKDLADELKDKVEAQKEITRCDIIGAPEREIQVNIDLFKMQAAGLTFFDIDNAIKNENMNISGGNITSDGVRRDLRLISSFKSIDDIKNIVMHGPRWNSVYLRDIANVEDGIKEQQSYARMGNKPVITVSVLKKSGENLINAADKINKIIEEFSTTRLPHGVKITVTNDMSVKTRSILADMVNSVIIGFILVTIVLMFFLGVQDSIFVGLAVPIASFLAFMLMPGIGFTFNMVVMFAFLLALGIIVDDSIVVVENTHRLHTREKLPVREAARRAAGEVFIPVLTGTLTTIAPFCPLLFWPGIVGKFMMYLPGVVIITLLASLFVAFIINPVLAVDFMDRGRVKNHKRLHISSAILVGLGALLHLGGIKILGNLAFILVALGYLNQYLVTPILIKGFQEKIFPLLIGSYKKTLDFVLRGRRPYYMFAGMIALFFASIIIFATFPPVVNFFPSGDPNYIYVYMETAIGTDASITDSVSKTVAKQVTDILGKDNVDVKSIVSNVGIGAGDPMMPDRTAMPHKGKITVAFVDHDKRMNGSTQKYLDNIRKLVRNYPGVEIRTEKENMGPPVGKAVNMEIKGDNLDSLTAIETRLREAIAKNNIQGIEKLKSDLIKNKPEIVLDVDRARANYYGLSSGNIGYNLRLAIFGKESSKFRDDKDDYSIQIRLDTNYRTNLNKLLNMPISFRDMATGSFHQIPISSVVKAQYRTTYASINHKMQKRTITLSSNVLSAFTPDQVVNDLKAMLSTFQLPPGYEIKFTGQAEDQKESADFLGMSFLIAIAIIMLILVTQFNSMIKTVIIIIQVVLSTIGVFLGFTIFRQTFSVVITGVGIVALAGIVVKNGIILIDFIDLLHERGGRVRDNIAKGGAIRFNPVVLTAFATALGVVPLAIGFNIDFVSFLESFNPHMAIGGDNAAFWGPLAMSIIYGLTFATFLTLVIVPCMYFMQYAFKVKMARRKSLKAAKSF